MDDLSGTTAITGLLAVSGIVIDILWDLNTSPKFTTAVLNLALREVKECRSSISALTKALALLETRQIPFPARATWIDLDQLVATLTDIVLAFSKLYALTLSIEIEANRSSPAEASRKYEKRLRALCARLKWHNLSIAMMMTIINCPADIDAKNSRDELVHRITRLLTFNVSLSARMRRNLPSSSSNSNSTSNSPVMSANISPSPHTYMFTPAPASSSPSPSLSSPSPPNNVAPTLGAPATESADVGRIPRTSSPNWPTAFSGFTLADAVLSLIRLPINIVELRDDRDFYPVAYVPPPASYNYVTDDGASVLGRSSIRSTSLTPSPPGSSWEPNDMQPAPAMNSQIAGPAAR
ncbi:hypothetical protein BGZ63DRAFT_399818 [Mariannaea sp. PMI_226]|nr:hypothetical protein BGZ63DRAFT_399818 [Mariannaea sp. PMI_226]